MGRQTHRKSYRAVRRQKFIARRIFVLVVLLVFIGGLTWLTVRLIGGGSGAVSASPSPDLSQTTPSPSPSPTAAPELPVTLDVTRAPAETLSAMGFRSQVYIKRDLVENYIRQDSVSFSKGSEYTSLKGVITYGGNNYRNTFAYGVQNVQQNTLTRVWDKSIGVLDCGSDGSWSGVGWTGMPLIIQWPDEVRPVLGVYEEFKQKQGFTEVIAPAMDGKIYFFELATGKATRDPIDLGVVNKGTASLDPRGYPLLYLGQGVQSTSEEGTYGAWFRVVSLIENKEIWSFGGADPASPRKWQAYDSSAILSAQADTLIVGGENGLLYTVKLNASFDQAGGTVSVAPDDLVKYRYTASGYGESDTARWYGIESSVAAWKNYAFFTDNGGYLHCVDLNTMTAAYAVDVTDDGDAGVVLEEDAAAGTIFLYTACKVDKQTGIADGYGKCWHRKIDALTGEILWEASLSASAEGNGGTLSTPQAGRGSISDLVIFNATLCPVTVSGSQVNGGVLIAYDKATGQEVWRHEQEAGYWSSPVVIYDENENGYIVQCDRAGMLRLHDGRTGQVLAEVNLGSRIEATPAVFHNMLVVGTRGFDGTGETQKIIGVKIG